jgi:uncharacterized phage-associated protein
MIKFSKDKDKERCHMANVFDVAKYILQKQGEMTTMKLQKLVYYCQAWSLVWDDKALFDDRIEAWASGPVVPSLYKCHRGQFLINDLPIGNINNLTAEQIETIDSVLEAYGNKPAQWLADLTHMEDPWNDVRDGFEPGENCDKEITQASMSEYYSSLPPGSEIY